MALLIDGYNLLYATDVFGVGPLAGTLQGSREALLRAIVGLLPQRERRQTRIVFDAAGAPPGLPATAEIEGLRVLFARGYADADALLEALIDAEQAPKQLVVVSGDHRVQRAARRRGAQWVDSSVWWRERVVAASSQGAAGGAPPAKPTDLTQDAKEWIAAFSDEPTLQSLAGLNRAPGDSTPGADAPAAGFSSPPESTAPPPPDNPFPPGYGEDLADLWDSPEDERRPR